MAGSTEFLHYSKNKQVVVKAAVTLDDISLSPIKQLDKSGPIYNNCLKSKFKNQWVISSIILPVVQGIIRDLFEATD